MTRGVDDLLADLAEAADAAAELVRAQLRAMARVRRSVVMRARPRVRALRPPQARRVKWDTSTRARPFIAPAARAATLVSSNKRRGRAEARSRFRIPTSAVGWNPAVPTSVPAAACQRRSASSRSHASRSLSPSTACNSITVAITRAGTVAGPAPSRCTGRRSSHRGTSGARDRPAAGTASPPAAGHRGSPGILEALLNLCPAQRHNHIVPGQGVLRSHDTNPARSFQQCHPALGRAITSARS